VTLRCLALLLSILSFFRTFAAEKPTLDHLYPAGACRGTTNDIILLGKFDPWPPKAWASTPGLDFQFTTNKGKAQLIISHEAKSGPCLVRIYNDEGPSDLRIFVVGDEPELLESEPNNHFAKAQVVTNLPATINGRLEKNGDVDSFRIELKGGQWLDAAVDSYTLLAKLDPVLRLVTTNGYQLAWNHDFSSLDPRLVWQAPYDLTAVIQVFGFLYPADADIRLSGGPAAVYRLHLNVSDQPPGDLQESPTEKEPNNSTNDAPALELPATVIGTICPAKDVDRFELALKKDQTIEARIQAASLGSPLDAWLAIENSAGKEIARNDDADNSRDPRLEWKAPEDGMFYVVIGSVTHQGSTDCRYHLSLRTLEPDYRITSPVDSLVAAPGTTNTLKLAFKRLRGFTNELSASVEHLPDGVRGDDLDLPAKDGEVSLPIIVATNAPAFNGPFHVTVRDKTSGAQHQVRFELVSRSENNGVPGGYSKLLVESTDDLWLTVKTSEQKSSPEKK
jgi:hypothetical protein